MLRRPLFYGLLVVAILLVAWPLVGRNTPRIEASDTHATELLRKAAAFLEAQKAFRVVVDVEQGIESQRFGKTVNKSVYTLSVARPGRLAMREQSGQNGVAAVADGKQFSRGVRALKQYVVDEAPSSLDDVFYDSVTGVICTGVGIPFFQACFSDHVYEELTYDVTESRDLGIEEIDGHGCEHLHLEQSGFVWDLWVDTGPAPLFRKVSIQPNERSDSHKRDENSLTMSVVYRFHDWEVDPKFAENEFVFDPPADWEKVDLLFSQGPRRDFANRPGSLTSLGEMAPDITITPLEGPAIPLADLQGRVVLLNFFATWCGPCNLELPDLQKIWNEFHGNDQFRLFVIGREESAETVQVFKDKHGFTFPMATDLDRSAFDRFATESIPRTYLIDRDGKIIYQCIGYDFEKRERKKLRALLKSELGKRE